MTLDCANAVPQVAASAARASRGFFIAVISFRLTKKIPITCAPQRVDRAKPTRRLPRLPTTAKERPLRCGPWTSVQATLLLQNDDRLCPVTTYCLVAVLCGRITLQS